MPRRAGHRSSGPDQVQPNLTPLLDVVLQLITFFMMLVHFGSRIEDSAVAVKLPVAPAALPGDDPGLDRLIVTLDTDNNLVSGREKVAVADQPGWWARQAMLRREGAELLNQPATSLPTRVFVRGDRQLAYSRLRQSLTDGQKAGFSTFSLVVRRVESP
ncbi:MAG: ExbD/TolR family protein [bacterium]